MRFSIGLMIFIAIPLLVTGLARWAEASTTRKELPKERFWDFVAGAFLMWPVFFIMGFLERSPETPDRLVVRGTLLWVLFIAGPGSIGVMLGDMKLIVFPIFWIIFLIWLFADFFIFCYFAAKSEESFHAAVD